MAADIQHSRIFKCGVCRSRINSVSCDQRWRCTEEIPQYKDALQCVCETLYLSNNPSKGILTSYFIALFVIMNYSTIHSIVSTRQQTSRLFNALKTLVVNFSHMIETACNAANINCIEEASGCSNKDSRDTCLRLLCGDIINEYDFNDILKIGSIKQAIEMAKYCDDFINILFMQCKIVTKRDAANKSLLHFHI